MKPVNFLSGMRIALQLESSFLGPLTTLRLDVNLNSSQSHHNGWYPRFPKTHLRTSVISLSPRVCSVNLRVRTPGPVRSHAFFTYIPNLPLQKLHNSRSRPRASFGMTSSPMRFSEMMSRP
jgi:hypothetical protein